MLSLQVKGELARSIAADARPASVASDREAMALLEARKGYGQFRVELPDRVVLSERLAVTLGRPGGLEVSIEELVRLFAVADRRLVVDTLTVALASRQGFSFIARLARRSGQAKTIECFGDVRLTDGAVTGAFGVMRDISHTIERQALAISRARLIRHMVEDLPVPVVVLDRALRVVGCSAEWAKVHGLAGRQPALGRPLGGLTAVSTQMTGAIVEALGGAAAQFEQSFYSPDTGQRLARTCVVIPWQCGDDEPRGVIMVTGGGDAAFATREIADQALSKQSKTFLELLETIKH